MLSFIFGNIAALTQTNIKRMLAYSSIAHMGYMLLGIVAGRAEGYAAAVFYMLTYTITAAGAFALISMLARVGLDVGDIRELRGLNSRHPMLALAMLMMMFSMAGIPPFVGFFAKLGVLEALISVHMSWLAVIALIASVIGAYYYLAIVKVMYFEETDIPYELSAALDGRILLFFNGLAVLFLGLFPSALYKLCQLAVLSL